MEDADGRRYVTPEGNSYESVTSFIGRNVDKGHLVKWKARIGEKEADGRTRSASHRGTDIHSLCEAFLVNGPTDSDNPVNRYAFRQAQPILREHVTLVHNVETRLYSDRLRLGGTMDALIEWDGVPAVLDFKTSERAKRREWIEHYFLQATAYAVMVFERVGLLPTRIVIMFIPSDDLPYFYAENPNKYLGKLLNLVEQRNERQTDRSGDQGPTQG